MLPPASRPPNFNTQTGTLKPEARSDAETPVPQAPALEFLISPQVSTLGPHRLHSGSRTQRRGLRPLAPPPSSGVAPADCRAPGSRRRRGRWVCPRPGNSAAQLCGRRPSHAAVPRRGGPFHSACGQYSGLSGMIDASNPLGPALFAAPLYLTPVLLHAGSPLHFLMFSWQKGVSLVASKMPPLRPWVGSNHKPLRLTAERYGESSTGFSWNLWG